MAAREIVVNADGDMMAYDGRILEIFFLDESKRYLAHRLRFERAEPDASGAVILQLWATKAQMVAMVRVEADHVADVDDLVTAIEAAKRG